MTAVGSSAISSRQESVPGSGAPATNAAAPTSYSSAGSPTHSRHRGAPCLVSRYIAPSRPKCTDVSASTPTWTGTNGRPADGWPADGWLGDGWLGDGWLGDGWLVDTCGAASVPKRSASHRSLRASVPRCWLTTSQRPSSDRSTQKNDVFGACVPKTSSSCSGS